MLELLIALALALTNLSIALADYQKPPDTPIIATITAYTSLVELTDDSPFITASGTTTRKGIIACPRKYSFGTKVIIQEEIYDCQDRLSLKYDDRFDIWFPTKRLADEWGIRKLQVYVEK